MDEEYDEWDVFDYAFFGLSHMVSEEDEKPCRLEGFKSVKNTTTTKATKTIRTQQMGFHFPMPVDSK